MFAVWTSLFVVLSCSGTAIGYQFPVPDFESPWLPFEAQAGKSKAMREIPHGLNEVPFIVDVQVKSLDAPNKGYIFQATGGIPRDDDEPEPYSGVVYIYDESKIIVSAPHHGNGANNGYAIYTEDGNYYTGANNQSSYSVDIRVRAWRMSSLPKADFEKTSIPMKAGNTTYRHLRAIVSDVYRDEFHGFNEYPSMILVRMNLTFTRGKLTAMADAVGANFVTYRDNIYRQNYHIVHGVSKNRIRVWIDSQYRAYIFAGYDGYPISFFAVEGYLEMYAWKPNTMAAQEYSQTLLGPNVPNETFEMPYKNNVLNPFTRVWVRSNTGPNAGFMFLGSGAMAYVKTVRDSVCSYGGLVYAYDTVNIRFWRPTSAINGGLTCVSHFFGNGTNSQMSTDAEVVIRSWGVDSISEYNLVIVQLYNSGHEIMIGNC
ncbi:uncharacterized protein LOC128552900 [Mercenaria mercenaria]|uniref:uncharacterized protein LOC128552900 n=1 Tax=Mercenaria mercenaria TaxID=6596 RepID=UPI00234FB2F9|nr:uncharacterized protein LOC128552900 [Mercenaria mercenaria]